MKTNDLTQNLSQLQTLTISSYAMAIGAVIAAFLSALVVLLLTPPRSKREWVVGITCTVVSSLCGGAAMVKYLGLESWAFSTIGLIAIGGIIFSCGLPGWAVVRWVFNYINENRNESIKDVVKQWKD
jgi:hypothetical protein